MQFHYLTFNQPEQDDFSTQKKFPTNGNGFIHTW